MMMNNQITKSLGAGRYDDEPKYMSLGAAIHDDEPRYASLSFVEDLMMMKAIHAASLSEYPVLLVSTLDHRTEK